MNWVDWVLIGFVVMSVAGGFAEGFVRIGIGFAALIFGFVFASWFHGVAAGWIAPYIDSKALASLLGFLLILSAILLLGALIGWIIQRVFKLIGLSWLDRLAGAAFGVVRGVAVLSIVALMITAFFPKKMPAAVSRSQLAPYVLELSKILAEVTPYEIKNGFEQSYEEFSVLLDGIKKRKKPELRYE
jgi:membrane protein required for colicin V production